MEAIYNFFIQPSITFFRWLTTPSPDPTIAILANLKTYNEQYNAAIRNNSLIELINLNRTVDHYITTSIPQNLVNSSDLRVRCDSLRGSINQAIGFLCDQQQFQQQQFQQQQFQQQQFQQQQFQQQQFQQQQFQQQQFQQQQFQQQAVTTTVSSVVSPPLYYDSTPFNNAVASMGSHLQEDQKLLISEIALTALMHENPRDVFSKLVMQFSGVKWGKDKCLHIQKTLLTHLPTERPCNIGKSISQIAAESNFVCFYKTGPTSLFGNFALCPQGICVWGQTFKCAEAAFQWGKFVRAGIDKTKLTGFFTATGEEAFQLSRTIQGVSPTFWKGVWESISSNGFSLRDNVMWEVLSAKFTQNSEMKKALTDTGTAYLLEHNSVVGRDLYWSDNCDGTGANRLGEMLMNIRSPLTALPSKDHVGYYANLVLRQGLSYKIDTVWV